MKTSAMLCEKSSWARHYSFTAIRLQAQQRRMSTRDPAASCAVPLASASNRVRLLSRGTSLRRIHKSSREADVSIIGAGLGGLVLARVLYIHGISTKVYEIDASPSARTQGGMLDIHQEDGQAALKTAGLYDEFLKLIHTGGEAARVYDKDGTLLLDMPDDGQQARPEVLRGSLRQMLLDSLPQESVQWGHKLSRIEKTGERTHELHFENRPSVTAKILVGADGAWSKVRPLLSSARVEYVGTTFVETFLYDCKRRHPDLLEFVGAGACYALAPLQGIVAHHEPNNVLHTYVALHKPLDWFEDLKSADSAHALKKVSKEYEGWSPTIRKLLTLSDTTPVSRPIHTLPVDHTWPRVPGVTLLGDAAHLMPPSGDGANLAMFDGAQLGLALAKDLSNSENAILSYEAELFIRSRQAAAEAIGVFDSCFGEKAPRGLLDMFAGHVTNDAGETPRIDPVPT